jgi:hypothetical protein
MLFSLFDEILLISHVNERELSGLRIDIVGVQQLVIDQSEVIVPEIVVDYAIEPELLQIRDAPKLCAVLVYMFSNAVVHHDHKRGELGTGQRFDTF